MEVAAVEGRNLADVEPFGEGYHARVHDLQAQRGVSSQELRHPAIVMGSRFDDPQLIFGDRSAELSG